METAGHLNFLFPANGPQLRSVLEWVALWRVVPGESSIFTPELSQLVNGDAYLTDIELLGGSGRCLKSAARRFGLRVQSPTVEWGSRRLALYRALEELNRGGSLCVLRLDRASARVFWGGEEWTVQPATAPGGGPRVLRYALQGERLAADIVVPHSPLPRISEADLSDEEWIRLGPLLLRGVGPGKPPRYSTRMRFNAVLAVSQGRCDWAELDLRFPGLASGARHLLRALRQEGRFSVVWKALTAARGVTDSVVV